MNNDPKQSLLSVISAFHRGRLRAVTIRDLSSTSDFEMINEREIRGLIRDLNLEGYPILTTTRPPYGVYYAESQEEINEYLANLGARMKAILERMKAVDRMRAQQFLKGQLELFS